MATASESNTGIGSDRQHIYAAAASVVNSSMTTSTPVTMATTQDRPRVDASPLPLCHDTIISDDTTGDADTISTYSAGLSDIADCQDTLINPAKVSVPIRGFEVMEERSRFTVFKIQVTCGADDSWFIFRRYSDFDHLNMKLNRLFPHFRLSLPPKKWFGDNFDRNFLEDRMIGLQAFLNNVVGHPDVCNSSPVKEFFCFKEPPGPHDSLEESRALCENLEECVFDLHQQVAERDARNAILEEELCLSQIQTENLCKALKTECTLYTDTLPLSQRLHSDHVINLVLLDLLERSKCQKLIENTSSTLASPGSIVAPAVTPTGLEQNHTSTSSMRNSPDLTTSCNLTASLAALETIKLSTITEQPPPPTTRGTPRSSRDSSTPETGTRGANLLEHAQTVLTPSSSHGKPSLPPGGQQESGRKSTRVKSQTGTGQLRSSSPGFASGGVAMVTDSAVASSSPTPKHVSATLPVVMETMSPGAHSVDLMTRRPRVSETNSEFTAPSKAHGKSRIVSETSQKKMASSKVPLGT